VPGPGYPALAGHVDVDVAIVGAGITGLTAAYEAVRSGQTVAVLERAAVAGAESARTTGFLTTVLDARLTDLVRIHGPEPVRVSWEGGAKAIDQVEAAVRDASIACDFKRVDAVLYGTRPRDRALLRRDLGVGHDLGFRMEEIDPGIVPFKSSAALRIPGQARLQPRRYLLGLARAIVERGGRIFERTNVTGLVRRGRSDGGARVETSQPGSWVTARSTFLANSAPFVDRRRLFDRVRACRSYAMSARIPSGTLPEGLYWNTLDPYDYARVDAGSTDDLFLLGGADHDVGRPGQPTSSQRTVDSAWDALVDSPPVNPDRWSGEILNSQDGLPFIGPNPGSPTHEWIATGFGGNGLTLGSLAGWMFAERSRGRPTPWEPSFDPGRPVAPTAGTALAPKTLHRAKRTTRTIRSLARLGVGAAAWYHPGVRRLGVFRVDGRSVLAVNARCTHLGCSIEWNPVEQSWDCPCHGSRFDVAGQVLDGPAVRPLRLVPLVEDALPSGAAQGRRKSVARRAGSRGATPAAV